MKIGISGAQSTGKSTLLKYLREDEELRGFEFVDELTRKIAEKGVDINEQGSNFTQIFTVTIHAEVLLKKHFISDRCILDGLVYTKWLYEKGKVDMWMLQFAERLANELLPKYDHIFYLPPEIPIEDDGVRSVNKQFRDEILTIFKEYIDLLEIPVHILTGSVAKRAEEFKRVLGKDIVSSGRLLKVETLFDLSSTDTYTDNYLTEAYQYWIEKGYNKSPDNKIFVYRDNKNTGWAFVREKNGVGHLSRFVVERKGQGTGGKVIQELQKKYDWMTLWSNPEALEFYTKHGFVFTKLRNLVDGVEYTFGEWYKKGKENE